MNVPPKSDYAIFNDAIRIPYYHNPFPLIGAGCIALYFTQTTFTVNVSISNSLFYNNTGIYSGGVAITTFHSILIQVSFNNCTFLENNYESTLVPHNLPYQNSGIKMLYLVLIGNDQLTGFTLPGPTEVNMLTITDCNFTRLVGAIRIEKLAANNLIVTVNIKDSNFTENMASTGAIVTAVDSKLS